MKKKVNKKAFLLIECVVYLVLSVMIISMIMRTVVMGWSANMKKAVQIDLMSRVGCAYDLIKRDISSAPYKKEKWFMKHPHYICWYYGGEVVGYQYAHGAISRVSGQWDAIEKRATRLHYSRVLLDVAQCTFTLSVQHANINGVTVTITMQKGKHSAKNQLQYAQYISIYNGPIRNGAHYRFNELSNYTLDKCNSMDYSRAKKMYDVVPHSTPTTSTADERRIVLCN